MTLSTLTLDQIPGLTDEECDALYAELSERAVAVDVYLHGRTMTAEEQAELPERLAALLTRAFAPDRVCHPDCPASVLAGLPGMVERWTGRKVELTASWLRGRIDGGPWLTAKPLFEVYRASRADIDGWPAPRHLPHACLSAAFAACVVLGRKG